MPTPTGLPKVGEVWDLFDKSPSTGWKEKLAARVIVLERGSGSYWSLRIATADGKTRLWVDASYYFQQRMLRFVGVAGPKTRKRFGLA